MDKLFWFLFILLLSHGLSFRLLPYDRTSIRPTRFISEHHYRISMNARDKQEDSFPISLRIKERQHLMSSARLTRTVLSIFYAMKSIRVEAADPSQSTLGVDNSGMFRLCPEDPTFSGCISSQDDRPVCFIAPWEYEGPWVNAKKKLVAYLQTIQGLHIISGIETSDSADGEGDSIGRYIRAVVEDTSKRTIDDMEFYFTPNDCIIQYRSIRREGIDFLARENRDRLERIRRALRLENIPVLRNRKSSLIFMESPIDSFGPPTIMFEPVTTMQKKLTLHAVVAELDPISAPIFSTLAA
jgi:uncharacterized protein (DUF1499 family)